MQELVNRFEGVHFLIFDQIEKTREIVSNLNFNFHRLRNVFYEIDNILVFFIFR